MVTSYLELEQTYTIICTIQLKKGRKNVYFIKYYIVTLQVVYHWLYINVVGKLCKGNNIWLWRHNIVKKYLHNYVSNV